MSKHALIVGAYGQLGQALAAKLPDAQQVDRDTLDITDMHALRAFDWTGIAVIYNAAAYTNVDGAETPEGRELAWKISASAVANLARIATEKDITLVHTSSDYVFDGTKEPHHEDEPYTPLSVYGASKAAGDIAASITPKHYICRTTWLIGEGKNFVRTMLSLAQKGIEPTVVADQIGRLTFADTLASAMIHLVENSAAPGVYNVTNDGEPKSWADITRDIFELAGKPELNVTDTTTEEYFKGKDGIAPRPLGSIMSLDKLKATGFTPTDWHNELKAYIKRQQQEQ